ncbi:hypothetical protein KP509_30G014000 [Ceratopteris richardii]|nr:hypothetical protein KP509_30G014000 [Ceratopteris richardii]
MKRLGINTYRFSISWPRLFPESSRELNLEGVAFYNNVIDCLVKAGVAPFVTLYHWDLPQYLQDDLEIKGWLRNDIIQHFLVFVDACFTLFGDRVKHWITINEIHMGTVVCCELEMFPPGNSVKGMSDSYVVAHNLLLAHAAAVKLYRTKYQVNQQGSIGMVADVQWYEPLSDIQEDRDAVLRCIEFNMGWILDPVFFGDYPTMMREILGEKLPKFTKEQSEDLKGSMDFLGLNYYFALWVTKAAKIKPLGMHTWLPESQTNLFWVNADGKLLGEAEGPYESAMFRSCPWGLRKVLASLSSRYGNIPIYITENGIKDSVIVRTLDERLNDQWRVKFLQDHIQALSESIREDKVNVKGYFHWSFTDTWEWFSGYAPHFGLYYIDFEDPQLHRTPKASARWFASFLKS